MVSVELAASASTRPVSVVSSVVAVRLDSLTIQGLQTSAQAIAHAAGGHGATHPSREMDFSSNENLGKWAGWVRASLYLSDFMSELSWETKDGTSSEVTLSYRPHGGSAVQPFFSVVRPDGDLFDKQLDLVRVLYGPTPGANG